MKNPLKTFGPNLLGRDFVIGDLHGAMACFRNLCAELHFDPKKDRMFSVADLVDRGPDSLECLRLIREDWFECVLSNHEQMMLEAFTGGRMGRYWFQNGGSWGHAAWLQFKNDSATITDDEADLFDLVNQVAELPFLITINHKSGKKFHILHAELPTEKGITDEMLADPETVRRLATSQGGDGDAFLWARYIFMPFYGVQLNKEKLVRSVKGRNIDRWFNDELSHIISGHTIMTQPTTVLGQTNIDTCAYGACSVDPDGWNALTCIDLDTWTFYQATPTTFKIVEPIAVNKADLEPTESENETDTRS